MTKSPWLLKLAPEQTITSVLEGVTRSADIDLSLHQSLDYAISLTRADMGTLQRLDPQEDCLHIVASRGFSTDALEFFATVRRSTNSTCAIALTRRMRVFVGDISNSYLFVGTKELEMLHAVGIAAAQSTPLISSTGWLCGVITTHFRTPQVESVIDKKSLDRFALELADSLALRESPTGIEDPAARRSTNDRQQLERQ
jgi:GAF domain-containing protein